MKSGNINIKSIEIYKIDGIFSKEMDYCGPVPEIIKEVLGARNCNYLDLYFGKELIDKYALKKLNLEKYEKIFLEEIKEKNSQ